MISFFFGALYFWKNVKKIAKLWSLDNLWQLTRPWGTAISIGMANPGTCCPGDISKGLWGKPPSSPSTPLSRAAGGQARGWDHILWADPLRGLSISASVHILFARSEVGKPLVEHDWQLPNGREGFRLDVGFRWIYTHMDRWSTPNGFSMIHHAGARTPHMWSWHHINMFFCPCS